MTCKKSYLSMASFFIPFMRGGSYMDGQQEWNKVRSQISKNLNPLQPKDRFAINDVIMKKLQIINNVVDIINKLS